MKKAIDTIEHRSRIYESNDSIQQKGGRKVTGVYAIFSKTACVVSKRRGKRVKVRFVLGISYFGRKVWSYFHDFIKNEEGGKNKNGLTRT